MKLKQVRPRLFFDSEWVLRFQKLLKANSIVQTEWAAWLKEADSLLNEPLINEDYADEVDSQHGLYHVPGNQINKMGKILGTVFQVTGEEKYASKLRDALLFYSRYRKWHGKGLARNDPAWHSELNTTRFTYGFALGYDAIYNFLRGNERDEICNALIDLGIKPILDDWIHHDTRIHALDSMGHNWWSVCVSQAGLAVVSILGDDERANQWLKEIVEAIPAYFTYAGSVLGNKSPNYDPNGAFYESVNYAQYGLYEYLVFRLAYNRITGSKDLDDIPMLRRAGDFFLHAFYPTEQGQLTVNFGDAHLHNSCSEGIKLLLANGFEDPRLRWCLQHSKETFLPYDFYYYESIWGGSVERPSESDTSQIYNTIGWAIIRQSWHNNSTLFAVKSGFTWNHAHADAGTFLLFHQGKQLLIDSGNCSYSRKEYQEYYLHSKAHNVVLFNGQGQEAEDLYRGVKEPGKLFGLINHTGFHYMYADACGPMSRYFKRNFRHYLYLDGFILIYDDLLAYEDGYMQWLLHYDGSAEQMDGERILVENGPARAIIQSLHPTELRIKELEGYADHNPDLKQPYLALETTSPSREAKYLTAILPALAGDSYLDNIPQITPFSGDEMIGASARYNDKSTDLYINLRADGRIMHCNSIKTMYGWETDAYMLVITGPEDHSNDYVESLERFFISCGSFVRRDGKLIFASLAKATVAFSRQGDELHVDIHGQPEGMAMIYPKFLPERLKVNGTYRENCSLDPDGGVAIIFTTLQTLGRPW